MKTIKVLLSIVTVMFTSILLLTSCQKDDGIGSSATNVLSVKMKMDAASTPTTKALAVNSLVFNSGSVIICEIVFDGEKMDDTSISITHEQVSTIDLVTGLAYPPVNVMIPYGTYADVNLGIEIFDENDYPSVIAEGIYTNSYGYQIPLRFEFNSGEVFEAEAESHTFAPGTLAIAQINFSPSDWFSTITSTMLDNAEIVNGVILINEETNTGIFDIVADKLDEATDATFQ